MTPLMLKEGNPDFGFVIYNHKKTALPTQGRTKQLQN